jgi:serine/threonine protein kinase
MVERRRGKPEHVKVLDFGIAKIQDAEGQDAAELTRTGFVCGTPEYMSPEQAKGAPLDARSDLYAVGILLYQLTTGLLPFDADSPMGFASKHLSAEPPPPSKRRPEAKISIGLERLILKALSKNPDDRPQTAEAFRSELMGTVSEAPRSSTRKGVASPPAMKPRSAAFAQAETIITTTPPWLERDKTVKVDRALLGNGYVSRGASLATRALGIAFMVIALCGSRLPIDHRDGRVSKESVARSSTQVERPEFQKHGNLDAKRAKQ